MNIERKQYVAIIMNAIWPHIPEDDKEEGDTVEHAIKDTLEIMQGDPDAARLADIGVNALWAAARASTQETYIDGAGV